MANTLVTIDMVTREALRVAHENCVFIKTTDRQYDSSYANTGAKVGSALRVRKPNQYTRTTGSRVMDVQDQYESSTTITLATQDHVDMRFNSAELALSIDEISTRYIEPAVKVLMSGVESDFIAASTKATYNAVGYLGTFVGGTAHTDLLGIGAARARLNANLAPKDGNRFVQMDSLSMGGLVNGLKGLFQDSSQIAEQYRQGMIGRTGMADFYENDRMWTLTNSDDVVGGTNAAAGVTDVPTVGVSLLKIYTDVAIAKQSVGQCFTITGVYACHPETKAAYSYLQPFTITAVETGTAGTTISPAIFLSGPRRNVGSVAGAALVATDFNTKTLTFLGAASASLTQNLMYHKEAFQFVTADLPIMDDAARCVRRTQDGISLRVWQASDIRNDELLMRIDLLYGFASLRPEWACRLSN